MIISRKYADYKAAVNIIVMRRAPLVGRVRGLFEGPTSEGGRKKKKEKEEERKEGLKKKKRRETVFYFVCIVSFIVFKHKREL